MNEEERKALIENIKAAIVQKMKEMGADPDAITKLTGRFNDLEQKFADIGQRPTILHGQGIANPFATDGFKQRLNMISEGHKSTGGIHLPGVGIKGVKALTTLPAGGTTGFPSVAQRGPTLSPVVAPLTLVDVLPSIPVSSDTFEFVQLTRTNSAAVQQNEGDQKAESEVDATLETAKIATIAHWTQASRQVLSDNAQLTTLLSNILGIDVTAKYEGLLLNGNGTTDKIHGLIPQATTFVHSKTHAPDRISECLASMWASGYVGSVVVMNPLDWSDFETERADVGDGQYVAGGWANPAAPSGWRTPVARAAGLAQGTALVIDQRFVYLLDREQVTTAVSSEDRDNFIKNLLTLLAEMRGGLAVYDTAAVQKVDLTGT
jgi:hypothetical protein